MNKLDKQTIVKGLDASVIACLTELSVYESISSTNDQLLKAGRLPDGQYVACFANQQTAGRGRNGHVWQSPVNANIYMSVGTGFARSQLNELSGLSLACGVSIAQMLESMGLSPSLKWPNDVFLNGKKLAGMLIETRVRADGVFVIIGLGLNVKMPDNTSQKIDRPWTDLDREVKSENTCLDRNYLAAQLLQALISCCNEYKKTGFDSFAAAWNRLDYLAGRQVLVKTTDEAFMAKVIGIDENYALRVEINNEEKLLYAADVSIDAGD